MAARLHTATNPREEWVRRQVAAAPPLTEGQKKELARIFGYSYDEPVLQKAA